VDLSELIEQDAIFPSLRSQTKKQVLQDLSERAAGLAGLSPRDVYYENHPRTTCGQAKEP